MKTKNKVFKRSGSYFIIISKENKILLQQHDPGASDPRYWSLFGGGIEENEKPRQAVIREAKEELGIKLKDFKFFKRYEILKENNWYELFIYTAPLSHSLEQLKNQQREGQGIGLFSYADSKKINISTIVKPIIEDIFDEINKNKKFIRRVSQFTLIDKQGKLLLQHRDKNDEYGADFWGLFGGGIGKGETPRQAVIREAKEELEIKPNFKLFKRYVHKVKTGPYEKFVYIAPLTYSLEKLRKQQLEGQNLNAFNLEEIKKIKKITKNAKIVLKDIFKAIENKNN